MKVMIRVMRKGETGYDEEGWEIGAYEGLAFTRFEDTKMATCETLCGLRVMTMYAHATRPDTVVLWCEREEKL